MPWLEKGEVLFIHVPRCGGTSITKHHRVGEKAQEGKNLWYRIGIKYYYYRYKLLESANFPVVTIENCIALFQFTLAFFLFFFFKGLPVPYVMWTMATTLFINSTFLWTAPILMRVDFLRNLLMYFQDQVLCQWGCDVPYLVGTNRNGYLFHLTAERCIRYGYVTEEDMKAKSFSIVRNPYSRAVSMYEYNKRLFESFGHFMRDFHRRGMKVYHEKGLTDSKYIYCHILPMYAYTHINGRQVVNTIIKQEHLKRLVATEWKDSGVPEKIKAALTGIPHANARQRKMAWQEYFTQETMDLVMEMYEKDFDIFGYDKTIPGRPELIPKIRLRARSVSRVNTEATPFGTMLRKSISLEETKIEQEINEKAEVKKETEIVKRRTVSISDKVETKIIEPKKFIPALEKIQERRGTSAGEETSEAFPNGSTPEVRKDSVDIKERKMSFSRDLSDRELFRKKRSASAFVLHVS